MRIDAYSAISQAYMPVKSQGVKAANAVASYGQDELQISSLGKDIQVAKQAVSQAPDVRADLVASMKAKYSGNDYEVDPGTFADALISRFNQTI